MKGIKSNLTKTDWQFVAESYLAIAYSGIEKLKSYIRSSGSEKTEFHKRESGWYRAYAAQLLLIPIVWNIKHAVELVLKAHTVNFQGKYFKTHDLSELKKELAKIFKIDKNSKDEKFNEFILLVDKYYKMEMFNQKLSAVFDLDNDFLRYPEGSNINAQLDLRAFGKITEDEIDGLLRDIQLIDLRLAIPPAEYQSIKNAGWNQFANPDNKI